ncbi:MAG: hypothetical protein FJ145_07250 [Deltaproteobacteria bacterium]|nr:hypothetical protein [Deltaproteobacteria bacterium]
MGQLVQLAEKHQARRRRSEKEHCVQLLEGSLKKSIADYFSSPRAERSMRATQIRKLSEILEYALRIL